MKSLYVSIVLLCSLTGYSQKAFTVLFGFNKYDLTAATRARLDSFLRSEKQVLSALTIELDGHCDSIGSDKYNNKLSEKRAMSVKQYLLKNGIPPAGIVNTGSHGRLVPLNENKTGEERQLNRRVEIRIARVSNTKLSATDESMSLMEKIADTATKAGTTIILKNINFFGGSPFPLPESFDTMDELLQTMKVNYNLVIEIRGHICCVAGPEDSEYRNTGNGLSEERARTVYAHLIGYGIEASRVSYKGFGHSLPIYAYPEKNEEERTANRRVEIKIISK